MGDSKYTLRIGTRGSRLALHQTHTIERRIKSQNPGLATEVVIIKTTGDLSGAPLVNISGTGLFTRELDSALVNEKIDMGVHSLKDLPTVMRNGVSLTASTKREVAQEAFLSLKHGKLSLLPEGACVGTGSPRRKAQLLSVRPDLNVIDFRGNVETRLRKMEDGEADATILACAGLIRLGLEDKITERLPLDTFIPAPGQGALGITVRTGDKKAAAFAACLIDPHTTQAVEAERAFLLHLGGGCKTPIACHATISRDHLEVKGFVSSPDGKIIIRGEQIGEKNSGSDLGAALANRFLAKGADKLLKD